MENIEENNVSDKGQKDPKNKPLFKLKKAENIDAINSEVIKKRNILNDKKEELSEIISPNSFPLNNIDPFYSPLFSDDKLNINNLNNINFINDIRNIQFVPHFNDLNIIKDINTNVNVNNNDNLLMKSRIII